MRVILDTNIYDKLRDNPECITLINEMIENHSLNIIVTRTVVEELFKSPFAGIPDYFPISYKPNTVSRAGIARAGDRLGRGDVFCSHVGKSMKINDGLIADAASEYAQYLVSEDNRLRNRMQSTKLRCQAMSFKEFKTFLEKSKINQVTNTYTRSLRSG